MSRIIIKKALLMLPYPIVFYFGNRASLFWRYTKGLAAYRIVQVLNTLGELRLHPWPSLHPADLLTGFLGAGLLWALAYFRSKNRKNFRYGSEYGSARWGTAKDIAPFMNKDFRQNIPLTRTEMLSMESRPKNPKYARNKNIICLGGSGSGKTRFFVKPSLMQMHSSYVVTDPKGTLLLECGKMLKRHGYQIKVLNTIDFSKSMKYNPFAYIRSEKDILKLVNTLIANTKGDGKTEDPFWEKCERLLYSAYIGYLWYEAPVEEQNFSMLLDMIDASEVHEEDENFKNAMDQLFDLLAEENPQHFAVRQYRKYKLAAGVINYKRFLIQSYERQPMAA